MGLSIKSLAQEVGSKGLDYVKKGDKIPLKVTGSGIPDDYVVKVSARGSNPDFVETVGVLKPDELGNVSKKFKVDYDFPGPDLNFKARINAKRNSNIYRGSEKYTDRIYSGADERIKEIFNKAKDTMKEEDSNSSNGSDMKNKAKNLVKDPKLVIPAVIILVLGLSVKGGGE